MLALFKAARNRSTRDWAMILLVYRHDLRASEVFIHEFNHERPHEALDMKYPGELYKPSTRPIRASENSSILFTIGQFWSSTAEESAFSKRKYISALLWPA